MVTHRSQFPEEPKADKEMVLEAAKRDWLVLFYACEDLKSDREVGLGAVNQDRYATECASDDPKAEKEVVFEAVKQNGLALECASPALRDGGLKSHLAVLIAALSVPA